MKSPLPVGKLPPELLASVIQSLPTSGQGVVLGPGIGLDCAVLEVGDELLALKSEPITFATEEIGWYSVQIAANDIATTGATPRWLLATVLLPEGKTTTDLVEKITQQLAAACVELGVTVIGGHTEITHGLDRPVINTTLIGTVRREKLVSPKGARPGNAVILTKGVPVEATAVLAREFPDQLAACLSQEEIQQAQDFLYTPGISVLPDARAALETGMVTAMHDPTEGGLLNALWELSTACGSTLHVDLDRVEVFPVAEKISRFFEIDPLASLASGALLLTCQPKGVGPILDALRHGQIQAAVIGEVLAGPSGVWKMGSTTPEPLKQPDRDEIARLFERASKEP